MRPLAARWLNAEALMRPRVSVTARWDSRQANNRDLEVDAIEIRLRATRPHLRSVVADALVHHIGGMVELPASEVLEELRRLKEELPMAVRRAAEAFREDPTRSSLNSATFRKARMADAAVTAIRRRIAEIERT